MRAMTPMSWVMRTRPAPVSLLEFVHQVEHLRLHGDVESRGGFVGKKHLRLAQHGGGDHHALAHAARKLVRELMEAAARFGNAHPLKPFDDALVGGLRP